jgi:hypothetical protein
MVPYRERGQLLILLGMWLFFGGGASTAVVVYDRPPSEVKKAIKRVVSDSARRDAMLSDIENWEFAQEIHNEEVGAARERLLDALRHRDTKRSDVEPTLARLDAIFLEMDRNFLDLRFRVKGQVTGLEWSAIVARPNR